MAIDPELAALLTQTAYAYAPAGTDAYGHTGYSATALTLPCHIVGKMQEVLDRTGETTISTGHLILGDVYPGLSDRYELDIPDPASATGRKRVNIVAVITRYDEVGAYNQVLYYGDRGAMGNSGGST